MSGLIWYGDQIKAMIVQGLKTGLLKCAMDLQGKSANEAPIDTGDLRGNCTVDDSEIESGVARVGYNKVYARRQHEELGYHHTDGKAKFLEDPFNANKNRYVKVIGEGLIK